jgi:hypothetical protein
MSDFTVPKRPVGVTVELAGGLARHVSLFLADTSPMREGGERVCDLLEGDGEFIPALDSAASGITFLRCDAILVARAPPEPPGPGEVMLAAEQEVEVALDDGRVLRGLVSYVLPPERSRLVDHLNGPARFLPLYRDGEVLFLNKRHVTRVAALER